MTSKQKIIEVKKNEEKCHKNNSQINNRKHNAQPSDWWNNLQFNGSNSFCTNPDVLMIKDESLLIKALKLSATFTSTNFKFYKFLYFYSVSCMIVILTYRVKTMRIILCLIILVSI